MGTKDVFFIPLNLEQGGMGIIIKHLHNLDIQNLDVLLRLFLVHSGILYLMHYIKPLNCPAENGVLVIQPWL